MAATPAQRMFDGHRTMRYAVGMDNTPHTPQRPGETVWYVMAVKASDAIMQVFTWREHMETSLMPRDVMAKAVEAEAAIIDGSEYIVVEDTLNRDNTHTLEATRFLSHKTFHFEHLT